MALSPVRDCVCQSQVSITGQIRQSRRRSRSAAAAILARTRETTTLPHLIITAAYGVSGKARRNNVPSESLDCISGERRKKKGEKRARRNVDSGKLRATDRAVSSLSLSLFFCFRHTRPSPASFARNRRPRDK